MSLDFMGVEGIRTDVCPQCGERALVTVIIRKYWDRNGDPCVDVLHTTKFCVNCTYVKRDTVGMG